MNGWYKPKERFGWNGVHEIVVCLNEDRDCVLLECFCGASCLVDPYTSLADVVRAAQAHEAAS